MELHSSFTSGLFSSISLWSQTYLLSPEIYAVTCGTDYITCVHFTKLAPNYTDQPRLRRLPHCAQASTATATYIQPNGLTECLVSSLTLF